MGAVTAIRPSTHSAIKRACQRQALVFYLPICRMIGCADLIGRQQNDRRAPDMLLGRIAISDHAHKANTVWWRIFKYDPGVPRCA